MKRKIITLTLLGLFVLGMSSCGTSRSTAKGHGGHCPAYGN